MGEKEKGKLFIVFSFEEGKSLFSNKIYD